MPNQFDHIYWLGGSPCAGKSTIAQRLAEQFGLTLYHCDTEFERQQQLITAESAPIIFQLTRLPCDKLWLRPVVEQLRTAILFYAEQFSLLVDELRHMPANKPILVEGAALLPTHISPYLTSPHRAMWVVPSERFQRTQYAQRPWIHEVLRECSQPDQAFEYWMQRDVSFACWVRRETAVRQLPCLVVDGKQSIAENSDIVAKHYALSNRNNE